MICPPPGEAGFFRIRFVFSVVFAQQEAQSVDHLPRRTIMGVCCYGLITISFMLVGPAMCVTAIATDMGMGPDAAKGLFLGIPFFGVTLAMLVAGPIADRWGFRAMLVTGSSLQALGLFAIAQAGVHWQVLAGGLVLGLGVGLIDPLLSALVCTIYPERRARMSNLLHAFYSIGIVCAVLLVLWLSELGWDWRGVFTTFAALVVPCVLTMPFLPLPKQSHQGQTRLPTRQIVFTGAFAMFLIGIFMAAAAEMGPASWLPSFVERAAKGARWQGGLGLLLFGVTMAIGRLSASAIVHRLGTRRMLMAGGVVCAASLLLAALDVSATFTIFWLTVLGFGVSSFWPTILGAAGDRYPQAGASLYSLLSAAGGMGCMVAPIVIGLAADEMGLRVGMAVLAAAPLAMMLTVGRMLGSRPGAESPS